MYMNSAQLERVHRMNIKLSKMKKIVKQSDININMVTMIATKNETSNIIQFAQLFCI